MSTAQSARTRVLIVAGDAMVAALLGMLLDPAQFEPVYPQPGERPEDTLARLRPPIAVLLDGHLEAAGSDIFLARAQRSRAAVILFTPPSVDAAPIHPARAADRGLSRFVLPVDRGALTRILDEAMRRAPGGSLGVVALCASVLALARVALPLA